MTHIVRRLDANAADFFSDLDRLLSFSATNVEDVSKVVRDIIANVRQQGDAAVVAYTEKFDRLKNFAIADLCLTRERLQESLQIIPAKQRTALEQAAHRIRSYHQHQFSQSWQFKEDDGSILGQQVTALDRVGLYVPGGKASYPSSVLMNAIPAKVAGDS